MSTNVQVAVRVRPFNARERKKQSFQVCKMPSRTQTIMTDPKNKAKKVFNFDHSFWTFDKNDEHFAGQEDVFQNLGVGVLDNAFLGFNACIFAYGQTGSGKTYTMMGAPTDPGLIPRLCTNLYERMGENTDEHMSYKVEVSYMEIYNEKVKDLLSVGGKKQNLKVRNHKVMGPYVEGLTKLAVAGYESIKTLMDEGNKLRHTAKTKMNDESSRSHAIFTLNFTQAQYDPATKQTGEKVSRISLVDLAGSERQAKTGATGAKLQEGANINKSLTNLGLVISALAKAGGGKKKDDDFVPYRNSVLTWLLKDNLGGNAKTVMLAALSPASDNFDETMSTLRFADRAKQIVNKAVVNEDPNARLIRELREELERLRSEVGSGGGGGGAQNSAEAALLKEKLLETENMIADMTKSWEDKLKESEGIIQEHRRILADHGATLGEAGQRGLQIESKLPHFVSLSQELDFQITIYSIPEGITRVGTANAETPQDVVISGAEVADEHCIVEHRVELDETEDPPRLREVVDLHPIGVCFVNGEKVTATISLRQGSVVQLGLTTVFRFNHPTEAARLQKLRAEGKLPDGLPGQESMSQAAILQPGKILEELKKQQEEELAAKQAELDAERAELAQQKLLADERAAEAQRQTEELRQMELIRQQREAEAAAKKQGEDDAKQAQSSAENEALRQQLAQMQAMLTMEAGKREGEAKQREADERANEAAMLKTEQDKIALQRQAEELQKQAEEERRMREENEGVIRRERKEKDGLRLKTEEMEARRRSMVVKSEEAERQLAAMQEHAKAENEAKFADAEARGEAEKVRFEAEKAAAFAELERVKLEIEEQKNQHQVAMAAQQKDADDMLKRDAQRRLQEMEDKLKRAQQISEQEKATLEKQQKTLELQMKLAQAKSASETKHLQKSVAEQKRLREQAQKAADNQKMARDNDAAHAQKEKDEDEMLRQKKKIAVEKAKAEWAKRLGTTTLAASARSAGGASARPGLKDDGGADLKKQERLREEARAKASSIREQLRKEKAAKEQRAQLDEASAKRTKEMEELRAKMANMTSFDLKKPTKKFDSSTAAWSGKDKAGSRRSSSTAGDAKSTLPPKLTRNSSTTVTPATNNPFPTAPQAAALPTNNPFGAPPVHNPFTASATPLGTHNPFALASPGATAMPSPPFNNVAAQPARYSRTAQPTQPAFGQPTQPAVSQPFGLPTQPAVSQPFGQPAKAATSPTHNYVDVSPSKPADPFGDPFGAPSATGASPIAPTRSVLPGGKPTSGIVAGNSVTDQHRDFDPFGVAANSSKRGASSAPQALPQETPFSVPSNSSGRAFGSGSVKPKANDPFDNPPQQTSRKKLPAPPKKATPAAPKPAPSAPAADPKAAAMKAAIAKMALAQADMNKMKQQAKSGKNTKSYFGKKK